LIQNVTKYLACLYSQEQKEIVTQTPPIKQLQRAKVEDLILFFFVKIILTMSVNTTESSRPESPASPRIRKFNIASLARQLLDQKKQEDKKLQDNR
jgi:hypothetical protein